ncbi:MAG: tetratricopeptide repeat protein [Planctomycetes bacterium]|nr:tetratricopeptide repeat protein [Planctomycetota bacterium]
MRAPQLVLYGAFTLIGLVFAVASPGHAANEKALEQKKAADKLRADGKTEEAIVAYQQVLVLDPEFVEAHHGYQDCMETAGKRKELLDEYRAKVEKNPASALLHYLHGRIVTDLAVKEREFKKALELQPNFFWPHYALGYLYDNQQKPKESLDAFKKAISLAPDSAAAHVGIGFAHMNANKNVEAIAEFEKAIAVDPNALDAYINLCYIHTHRTKDYAKAVEAGKKALKIDPENPWVHNNLGSVYYHQGRYSEAVREFKKAASNPRYDTPEVAQLNLGFAYRRQQKLILAAEAYKKAIALNPNFAYAHNDLAQVYYHQKKYDDAWKHVKIAQELGHAVNPRFLADLKKASGRNE